MLPGTPIKSATNATGQEPAPAANERIGCDGEGRDRERRRNMGVATAAYEHEPRPSDRANREEHGGADQEHARHREPSMNALGIGLHGEYEADDEDCSEHNTNAAQLAQTQRMLPTCRSTERTEAAWSPAVRLV